MIDKGAKRLILIVVTRYLWYKSRAYKKQSSAYKAI